MTILLFLAMKKSIKPKKIQATRSPRRPIGNCCIQGYEISSDTFGTDLIIVRETGDRNDFVTMGHVQRNTIEMLFSFDLRSILNSFMK